MPAKGCIPFLVWHNKIFYTQNYISLNFIPFLC